MMLFPIEDISINKIFKLENYLFKCYLYTILRIFILLTLLLLPILVPLNVINGKNKQEGVKGLNRLSFANVRLSHTNCY
jgi:calcium permeable stress-gated cation channel